MKKIVKLDSERDGRGATNYTITVNFSSFFPYIQDKLRFKGHFILSKIEIYIIDQSKLTKIIVGVFLRVHPDFQNKFALLRLQLSFHIEPNYIYT